MTKYNCYLRLKGSSAPWELDYTVECRSQEEADFCAEDCAFNWFQGECQEEDKKLYNECYAKFRALYPDMNQEDLEEDAIEYYYHEVINRMEFCAIPINQ